MTATLIISVTSDIGLAYAKYCYDKKFIVHGTYRNCAQLYNLRNVCSSFFHLDLSSEDSVKQFKDEFSLSNIKWSYLVFCPCQPYPYENFFSSKFTDWAESFQLNSLRQLELLHYLYDYRASFSKVLFFSGGGTNSAVNAFSAYTSAKIHLIKMVELLDSENIDMTFTVLGPGWVKTKTHLNVFQHTLPHSDKYKQTSSFLSNPEGATPMYDVVQSISWIFAQPKNVVGGRNFSSAYDPIDSQHPDSSKLVSYLENDSNMFKLRRSGNHLFSQKRFL